MESMPHPSYKSHPIVRNHDSTIARITKLTTKAPKGRHDLNQGCNPWHLQVNPLPLLQERAGVRSLPPLQRGSGGFLLPLREGVAAGRGSLFPL